MLWCQSSRKISSWPSRAHTDPGSNLAIYFSFNPLCKAAAVAPSPEELSSTPFLPSSFYFPAWLVNSNLHEWWIDIDIFIFCGDVRVSWIPWALQLDDMRDFLLWMMCWKMALRLEGWNSLSSTKDLPFLGFSLQVGISLFWFSLLNSPIFWYSLWPFGFFFTWYLHFSPPFSRNQNWI